MTAAQLRAAGVTLEKEKAQEFPLLSPQNSYTHNRAGSAGRPVHQEVAGQRKGYGADGSKLITSVGHLKWVIRCIHDLIWHRYKRKGVPSEIASQYYYVIKVVDRAAQTLDEEYVSDINGWTERNLSKLSLEDRIKVDQGLEGRCIEVTQRWIGEELGLEDEERTEVKFMLALAYDVTDEEREARRKAKDAERQRAKSKTPRALCAARLRELEPEVPTSTWYARRQGVEKDKARPKKRKAA